MLIRNVSHNKNVYNYSDNNMIMLYVCTINFSIGNFKNSKRNKVSLPRETEW